MYANPLLIVQTIVLHFQKSICVLQYSGGDFWKYLNGEFVFHVTIKIHYSFIVCRISFSQEDVHLQSFTEQYFIVNELFWENWVKFKIQNLHICTVWIGHNLLTSWISKLSQVYTQANTHGEVAKSQPSWTNHILKRTDLMSS